MAGFVSFVTCEATVGQKPRRDEQSRMRLGEEDLVRSALTGGTLSRPGN